MKKLLYFNNLHKLPNFGCRSTGKSLKNQLKAKFHIIEYDAIHSVLNSPGWDEFAENSIKFGGFIPYKFWNFIWRFRYKNKNLYHNFRKLDALFGGNHDFIVNDDPRQSLINFFKVKNKFSELSELYERILEVDLVCINGEGTFLISNKFNRDASYYFFIILLCRKLKKRIFLLNCMVDKYAFEEVEVNSIEFFIKYLAMFDGIMVRDYNSKFFLTENNLNNVEFCLDALFSWEVLFDDIQLKRIKENPVNNKYILISGTSASKFYEESIAEGYRKLIRHLKKIGIPIIIMESCIGDRFLKKIAEENKLTYIGIESDIVDLYQYISNSYVFISGRYHPTVVAMSQGIPCISLKCNSNKMENLQKIINNSNVFPTVLKEDDINEIFLILKNIISDYDDISTEILKIINCKKSESYNVVDFLDC